MKWETIISEPVVGHKSKSTSLEIFPFFQGLLDTYLIVTRGGNRTLRCHKAICHVLLSEAALCKMPFWCRCLFAAEEGHGRINKNVNRMYEVDLKRIVLIWIQNLGFWPLKWVVGDLNSTHKQFFQIKERTILLCRHTYLILCKKKSELNRSLFYMRSR